MNGSGAGSEEQPEWLTLGLAAKYLGVAPSSLRKWADSGRVSTFRTPGAHRRFRKRDLDEFLVRSSSSGQPPGGPLILVVDDEPGIRAYVRASLEPDGYQVEEAAEAEEGLELAEAHSPDLVLIDTIMARTDGWEMLRRLRESRGNTTPQVIMFSAREEGDERLARSRGANAFIGKPFDPRRLVERARRALPL
jgi:excisionase family DNA binding protein